MKNNIPGSGMQRAVHHDALESTETPFNGVRDRNAQSSFVSIPNRTPHAVKFTEFSQLFLTFFIVFRERSC
jgi:hypothetical protein